MSQRGLPSTTAHTHTRTGARQHSAQRMTWRHARGVGSATNTASPCCRGVEAVFGRRVRRNGGTGGHTTALRTETHCSTNRRTGKQPHKEKAAADTAPLADAAKAGREHKRAAAVAGPRRPPQRLSRLCGCHRAEGAAVRRCRRPQRPEPPAAEHMHATQAATRQNGDLPRRRCCGVPRRVLRRPTAAHSRSRRGSRTRSRCMTRSSGDMAANTYRDLRWISSQTPIQID